MRARITGAILAGLLSASAHAQGPVRHVPLYSLLPQAAPVRAKAAKAGRGCVPVAAIAGAIVLDDRSVELSLKDGSRWTMRFAEACPALGYYQGFYYRRTQVRFLCAKHDAVMARSGGECPIDSLSRTQKPRKKR